MVASSCQAFGATIRGVDALLVKVEVALSNGIPSFSIVGMPDTAIQESRERVKAAIRACGFQFPASKIVVNLAPGSLRKHGSGFDLPIALCILCAAGQLDPMVIEGCVCAGELSLDGAVASVAGLLPVQLLAQREGLCVLTGTLQERYVAVEGVRCTVLPRLDAFPIEAGQTGSGGGEAAARADAEARPDFAQVQGHERAKRALEVAAAGMHDVLMVGPPGSGKTLLASCLPSILPPLAPSDALETAVIHSAAGVDAGQALCGRRPFRAPHHSVTMAGLIGGGVPVHPGEASLAHNGVLFLDELSEFRPNVLQALRQPLETGEVALTRADGLYRMPSRFLLVGATNPCPCGHFGDKERPCRCSQSQVQAYQNRIGGPLYDRIDIRIDVMRPDPSLLTESHASRGSSLMAEEVASARVFRKAREEHARACTADIGQSGTDASPQGAFDAALRACGLDAASTSFFQTLMRQHVMSARSGIKTLKLARTIADLDGVEQVREEQLAEACMLRFQSGLEV